MGIDTYEIRKLWFCGAESSGADQAVSLHLRLKKGRASSDGEGAVPQLAWGVTASGKPCEFSLPPATLPWNPGGALSSAEPEKFRTKRTLFSGLTRTQVEVRDYLEIRSVCEPLAAKLAIERCSQKDLARLHSIHNAFVKATEEHDMQSILLQEGNFHDSIIELSQNQLLINIFRFFQSRTQDFRYQSLRLPNGPQEAILPHFKILRAFDLHDPELGETAMREHVKLGMQNYQLAMIDAEYERMQKKKEETEAPQ